MNSFGIACVHHDDDPIHLSSSSSTTSTSSSASSTPKTSSPPTSSHPIALTFSRDSTILIAGQSDSSLLLYNASTSKQINTYRQLELGISLVEPTHHRYAVICSPARKGFSEHHKKMTQVQANRLYCWDLFSNHIVAYLKGHDDDIQSMNACLSDESIVSTDIRGVVRLWDLRSGVQCVTSTSCGAQVPCAAGFSCDGRLLAIAGVDTENQPQVNIFDRRRLSAGPLSTTSHHVWNIKTKSEKAGGSGSMFGFSRIKFSPNGDMILATPYEVKGSTYTRKADRPPMHTVLSKQDQGDASSNMLYTVADDLGLEREIRKGMPRLKRPEASFSSDSKHILFGDEGKVIQVWKKLTKDETTEEMYQRQQVKAETGKDYGSPRPLKNGGLLRVAKWEGHMSSIGPIRWSPKTNLVASGGGNLLMWRVKNINRE